MRSSTALFNSLLVGVLLSLALTNIGFGPGMAEAGWGRCRWSFNVSFFEAMNATSLAGCQEELDGGAILLPGSPFNDQLFLTNAGPVGTDTGVCVLKTFFNNCNNRTASKFVFANITVALTATVTGTDPARWFAG